MVDVAVCWNYLVVAEGEHVTKYGLVNSKPGLLRLDHPPGSGEVTQLSATPRHILSVTSSGECWTHEEGKVLTFPVFRLSYYIWFQNYFVDF